jgi:hypothetical protein
MGKKSVTDVTTAEQAEGEWFCVYERIESFKKAAEKLCARTERLDQKPTMAAALKLVSDYHEFLHSVLETLIDVAEADRMTPPDVLGASNT